MLEVFNQHSNINQASYRSEFTYHSDITNYFIESDQISESKFEEFCYKSIDSYKPVYGIKVTISGETLIYKCNKYYCPKISLELYLQDSISSRENEKNTDLINQKKFIKEIVDKKSVCIVDSPGTGKSTILSQVAKRLAPENFIIHIGLKELKKLKDDNNIISEIENETQIYKFLIDSIKPDEKLKKIFISHKLKSNSNSNTGIVILFDDFDKIESNEDKDIVIKLIQHLRDKAIIIISSGDSAQKMLQQRLDVSIYKIQRPGKDKIEEYIKFYIENHPKTLKDQYNYSTQANGNILGTGSSNIAAGSYALKKLDSTSPQKHISIESSTPEKKPPIDKCTTDIEYTPFFNKDNYTIVQVHSYIQAIIHIFLDQGSGDEYYSLKSQGFSIAHIYQKFYDRMIDRNLTHLDNLEYKMIKKNYKAYNCFYSLEEKIYW